MNSNRFRILLAEKDAITAVDIVNIISDIGFDITSVVDSALDAITKTEIDRPDLILMDIQLRGSLNGVEAARILSFKYNIPVVFITTPELQQIFSHDPSFKYKDCIIKPVNHKKIFTTLEKSLLVKKLNHNLIQDNSLPPADGYNKL